MKTFRLLAIFVTLMIAAGVVALHWRDDHRIHLHVFENRIPANGNWQHIATLASDGRPLNPAELTVSGIPLSAIRVQEEPTALFISYRPPVVPTNIHLVVRVRTRTFVLNLITTSTDLDTFSDGTPDWMRLHTAEDRASFRQWFTELTERMADTPLAQQPAEIVDCASLLRYSYREALRTHDDKWYRQFDPADRPSLPSVQQWSYPNTPIGIGLFRIRPGAYQSVDATNGAFQAFADAKTLMSYNTSYLGRDIHIARAGDLFFYRVLEQESQYHSMIVTGERSEWVVYHTGPIDKHRGEMRRVMLSDLLHHPNPKWRPLPENPNFLGVYRWNILRAE